MSLAGAPLAKFILVSTASLSLLSSVFQFRPFLPLSLPLLRQFQLWRIFSSQIGWQSTGELLYGGLLIFNQARLWERRYGTSRVAGTLPIRVPKAFSPTYRSPHNLAIATISALVSLALQIAYLFLRPAARPVFFATGPYAFVWTALIYHLVDIPSTYNLRIMGISLADSWFPLFVGVQLALVGYPASVYSSISGILAGLICKFLLPDVVARWRYPLWFRTFCASWILPYLDSPPQPRGTAPNFGSGNANAIANANAATQAPSARPPPDQRQVEFLVQMGFPRDAAIQALRETDGDPNAAAELLLRRAS